MSATSTQDNAPQLQDEEVIRQVLEGRTALFELIIRRYNPYLYKTGRAYGFNHQDTQDLMQETYIQAFQHLAGFEGRSSLKTWMIRILLNQCYHRVHQYRHQHEKPMDAFPDPLTAQLSLGHNHSDTMQAVIKEELSHVIEASLGKLPQHFRLTFTLREINRLSVAETAEVMKTSQANVKVRLNRAKSLLRKEIEKMYEPEDIYAFNLVYCDQIVEAVMAKIKDQH